MITHSSRKCNIARLCIVLAFGFILPQFVNAQVRFSFSTGYGTYAMDELSALQAQVAKDFPIPGETTTYPGYLNFEGGVLYDAKFPMFFGIITGYGSSGARTFYGDYSGSLYFDQLATYNSINVSVGYYHKFSKGFRMYIDLHPGITYTNLKISSYENIGQQSLESLRFKSKNAGVEPTVGILKKFGVLGISAYVGYNINLSQGKLEYSENNDAYLIDANQNPVNADWSGLRAGISVSLYLRNSEKDADQNK